LFDGIGFIPCSSRVSKTFKEGELNMSRTIKLLVLLGLILSLALAACGSPAPTTAPATEASVPTEVEASAPANPTLILATTTSTQDSGLLDVLVPMFEEQSGYTVQTIAVGSGEAMKMGEEGNADVLLVHAPASEVTFMEADNGTDRFLVMHNDFIVVGPAADPAEIKGMTSATDAFTAIFNSGTTFITRGDDSGTHKKELALWTAAGLDPAGQAWYTETGQGMGASMTVASEKEAYILTDRATYLANMANYQLEILVEGDTSLLNVYHVITVSQDKWPDANYEGALAFANFMIADATQEVIGQFGAEEFGQPLFFPDADKTDEDLGL
jgi:tungstate transport system substrate-binding protein